MKSFKENYYHFKFQALKDGDLGIWYAKHYFNYQNDHWFLFQQNSRNFIYLLTDPVSISHTERMGGLGLITEYKGRQAIAVPFPENNQTRNYFFWGDFLVAITSARVMEFYRVQNLQKTIKLDFVGSQEIPLHAKLKIETDKMYLITATMISQISFPLPWKDVLHKFKVNKRKSPR